MHQATCHGERWRAPWLIGAIGLWFCAGPGAASGQDIQYVIQISVDGLHSGQLQTLMQTNPDGLSNFRRFLNEGATTFNARTDATNTFTLPNHTSMITGRPVNQVGDDPTLHHGYLNNSDPAPTETLHNGGNPLLSYVASTFDQAHDHSLSTALYTGKDKFVVYERSYNVTETSPGGRPDAYLDDGDQGINKIDKYEFEVVKGTSSGIVQTFVEDYQSNPFNYALVHFLEPDAAGHTFGWRSSEYNEIVELVDQHLGKLFQVVESQPLLAGHTAILLTSDHGGSLLGHDEIDDPNMFRIPFFVWGPGVAAGANLYDLNPLTRLDPGREQPDYLAPLQPIRNGDSPNLAMALLGLPSVDGSSINVRQDLRVELPRDAVWDGDAAGAGQSGDGRSWMDQRNWTRGTHIDRAPVAGDVVWLPAAPSPQQILLDGAQHLHALHVEGDYQLGNGDLQLLTGDVLVAENQQLTIDGALSSPRGIIKDGQGRLRVELVESDLLVAAGSVEGPLVVEGDLANRGLIAPSGPRGVVVHGDFTQTGSGTLRMSLAADGSGDQMVVDDLAIYRGTLALEATDPAADPADPGQFTRWTLAIARRRLSSFSAVTYNGQRLTFDPSTSTNNLGSVHVGDGLFRRLEYNRGLLEWVNYRAIPGDVDGNGAFNTQDLVGVFALGGYENGVADDAQWISGDWNGDGDFTSSDLVTAFSTGQFEQPSILVPAAARPVPEPGTWPMALLAWGSLLYLLRRCSAPSVPLRETKESSRRGAEGAEAAGDANAI